MTITQKLTFEFRVLERLRKLEALVGKPVRALDLERGHRQHRCATQETGTDRFIARKRLHDAEHSVEAVQVGLDGVVLPRCSQLRPGTQADIAGLESDVGGLDTEGDALELVAQLPAGV